MADTFKVTVTDGYALYVHGQHHVGGQTVDVPADLAEKWTAKGWASEAKAAPKRKAARK